MISVYVSMIYIDHSEFTVITYCQVFYFIIFVVTDVLTAIEKFSVINNICIYKSINQIEPIYIHKYSLICFDLRQAVNDENKLFLLVGGRDQFLWKTLLRRTENVVTFTTLLKTGNNIFLYIALNERLEILSGAVVGFTTVKIQI